MRLDLAIATTTLCAVTFLTVSAGAETIELYPVGAATISGVPEGADAENIREPRVFVRFDVSSIRPGIHIDYAELTIGDVDLPQGLPYAGFVVSKVLTEWNGSDISWDHPSGDADWENPGGDWDEVEFVYGAAGAGLKRPPFFNVTSDVRGWVSGESEEPNYGFMLKPVDDPDVDSLVGILHHTRLRPMLKVSYSVWE